MLMNVEITFIGGVYAAGEIFNLRKLKLKAFEFVVWRFYEFWKNINDLTLMGTPVKILSFI